jgi:hypothetical protein
MNKELALLRIHSQQLISPDFHTPKDIVLWMGAIQAQDFQKVRWAVGIRLNNCTSKDVERAISKGTIIRTHVLRPTWHLVAPENLRWMLALSASRIKTSMRSRDRELGLNEELYLKALNIIVRSLEGKQHRTREDLGLILEREGLPATSAHLVHYLIRAEVDALVCSGAIENDTHTYALLDERIPRFTNLTADEALASLAHIYYTSHGPATLEDYIWWSGLAVSQAKQGLEEIRGRLGSITYSGRTYYYSDKAIKRGGEDIPQAHLLPAYDEYIIAYRDRSAALPTATAGKVVSSNGIFRPVVTIDGIVEGIWKRVSAIDCDVNITFFNSSGKTTGRILHDAIDAYKRFSIDPLLRNPK